MRWAAGAWLLSALAVTACAPPAPSAVPAGPPAGFPAAFYRQAIVAGNTVYRIEPGLSRVVIRVHRAGPLAAFGHEHVVASRDLHGYALLARSPGADRADLYLPLTSLEVDAPALRKSAGLGAALSPTDVLATRDHMLHPVLEADRYPYAEAHIAGLAAKRGHRERLRITFTLHGRRRSYDVPVQMDWNNRRLHVSGRITILQTSFAIRPYAVLGGALRVADELQLAFEVSGVRQTGVAGAKADLHLRKTISPQRR